MENKLKIQKLEKKIEKRMEKKNIFKSMLPYLMCAIVPFSFNAKAAAESVSDRAGLSTVITNEYKVTNVFEKTKKSIGIDCALTENINLGYSYSKISRSAKITDSAEQVGIITIEPGKQQVLKLGESVDVAGYNIFVSGFTQDSEGDKVWIDITEINSNTYEGTVDLTAPNSKSFTLGSIGLNLAANEVKISTAGSSANLFITATTTGTIKQTNVIDPNIEETIQELKLDYYQQLDESILVIGLIGGIISRIENYTNLSKPTSYEFGGNVYGVKIALSNPSFGAGMNFKNYTNGGSEFEANTRINLFESTNLNLNYYKGDIGKKIIWSEESWGLEILQNLYIFENSDLFDDFVTQIGIGMGSTKRGIEIKDISSTRTESTKEYTSKIVLGQGGLFLELEFRKPEGQDKVSWSATGILKFGY